MKIDDFLEVIYKKKNKELVKYINKNFSDHIVNKKATSYDSQCEIESNIDVLTVLNEQTLVFALSRMNAITIQFEAEAKLGFLFSLIVGFVGAHVYPVVQLVSDYYEKTGNIDAAFDFSMRAYMLGYAASALLICLILYGTSSLKKKLFTASYFVNILEHALKKKKRI